MTRIPLLSVKLVQDHMILNQALLLYIYIHMILNQDEQVRGSVQETSQLGIYRSYFNLIFGREDRGDTQGALQLGLQRQLGLLWDFSPSQYQYSSFCFLLLFYYYYFICFFSLFHPCVGCTPRSCMGSPFPNIPCKMVCELLCIAIRLLYAPSIIIIIIIMYLYYKKVYEDV